MSAELAPRTVKVVLAGLQVATGAVVGWFTGIPVLFSALIIGLAGARRVGLPPEAGDLTAASAIIVWALLSLVATVITRRLRPGWHLTTVGFAVGTVAFAAVAVFLFIPFGASMRDFD